MSQGAKTTSVKFPEGYGDVVLESSDGVGFHFPRFLLSHSSPFFHDMFNLPAQKDANGIAIAAPPLVLEEPSATVEPLLVLVDPMKHNESMEPETIFKVASAAHKYQFPQVATWLEQELSRGSYNPTSGLSSNSQLESDPCFAAFCAVQFDLPSIGKQALQVIARRPDATLRGKWFKLLPPSVDALIEECVTERRERYRQVLQDIVSRCSRGNGCDVCYPECLLYFVEAAQAIQAEPSWATLSRTLGSESECLECGNYIVPTNVVAALDEVQVRMDQLDGQVPKWL